MRRRLFHALIFTLALGGVLFSYGQVNAAAKRGFEAVQVTSSGSGTLTLTPGEVKDLSLEFQNIGVKNWTRTGSGYVSIYTYGPKYRTSVFADASWESKDQPARLHQELIKPTQVGNIFFKIKAPEAIGVYKETFHLAAEDTAWIPGGEFTLEIRVVSKTVPQAESTVPSKTETVAPSANTEGLSAFLLLRSQKQVTARGGETVSFKVGVKNTGTKTWTNVAIQTPQIALASVSSDETRHTSWVSQTVLATKSGVTIAPGSLEFIDFSFSAPRTSGSHIVRYKLSANGAVIPEFEIDIPVTVTSNAPAILNVPRDPAVPEFDSTSFIPEPIVRIGVLIVDEETDWQIIASCETPSQLFDGNGALLAQLESNERVTLFYKEGKYWFNRGKGLESTSFYLRLVPGDLKDVCTAHNFDRTKTRKAAYPDNQFRGAFELRYNSAKDRTWLINELSIEQYLRGLAETSNYSEHEFKKTLITIARTYALYHFERGTKHKEEFYHMNAYADDQVYKGYGYEVRHPLIGKAAEDTVGRVVTYDGKVAITPYFSRSDGRTRDWSEVWYGTVPWIKSVPAPCDVGKTLWGHGVGLSASEALCQAKAGKKWDDILHYFYQDVTIAKWWE